MKKILALVAFAGFGTALNAQILNVSPAFPTVDDVVTITYNATAGNGALSSVTPVYAHTGVIVAGNALSNWQYVQGTWGTADPEVLMTNLGGGLHQITIDIDQFYGFPSGTNLDYLSFVFRNASGSIVGRAADGGDIYYPIYPVNSGLLTRFFQPENAQVLAVGDILPLLGKSNELASLSIKDNGVVIASATNANQITHNLTATAPGNHWLELIADNGSEVVIDSLHYVVSGPTVYQDPPAGTLTGLNYINDSTVLLKLVAPEKESVYVIGDFTNWQTDANFQMNCSLDSTVWWLSISNLDTSVLYGYQYLIDNEIVVADPMSYLVADPSNDSWIDNQTYSERYVYPSGQTSGFVSFFKTNPTAFNWQNDGYQRPQKKELMIYELLVRDFIAKHNYETLIDTLDYLDNLGINAIELMPIGEFEGNESWGYNPSFHMALDKYYGSPEQLKAFVDACHERGIAVIMDIALNHTFGQSQLLKMYWNATTNAPAANNPWYNVTCPHPPYCWGYDLNHEGQPVKDYIDRVNHYWLDEFHIDGFRFDYTKGFVNSAANYSNTRIDILKRMVDTIWSVHPDAYVILEHWADNAEEKILANYGMLLWGNLTYDYHNAMKGNASNFINGLYTYRGWDNPHLVTYIESHDEERGMYENLTYGLQTNPEHNVRDLFVGLKRSEAAAVMMLTTPGPKMIWQFGELGYDYSINTCTDGVTINNACRTYNKPIRWDYYLQNSRRRLFDVYKATMDLRANEPTFQSLDFSAGLASPVKQLYLNDPDMDAVVVGNFSLASASPLIAFQQTGWWYDYFSGDSLEVTTTPTNIAIEPGGYRIWTTKRLATPNVLQTASVEESLAQIPVSVYPVPTSDQLTIEFYNTSASQLTYSIVDLSGRTLLNESIVVLPETIVNQQVSLSNLAVGSYVMQLQIGDRFYTSTVVKE